MRARRIPTHLLERPALPLSAGLADLVRRAPDEVCEALGPLLIDQRRERIEAVIASRTRSLVLVLEHLDDPHNGAAILRTAEAMGLMEVHAIQSSGAWDLSRRVTQGCHKWLDVIVFQEVEDCAALLERRGYLLLAASEKVEPGHVSIPGEQPVALCLGNEHFGLTAELRRRCRGEVGVSMLGFTRSLNVSVAAAVLISRLMEGRPRGLAKDEQVRLRARYYAQSVRGALDVLRHQEIR